MKFQVWTYHIPISQCALYEQWDIKSYLIEICFLYRNWQRCKVYHHHHCMFNVRDHRQNADVHSSCWFPLSHLAVWIASMRVFIRRGQFKTSCDWNRPKLSVKSLWTRVSISPFRIFLKTFCIKELAWSLKFLGYLRTLCLKFQKATAACRDWSPILIKKTACTMILKLAEFKQLWKVNFII